MLHLKQGMQRRSESLDGALQWESREQSPTIKKIQGHFLSNDPRSMWKGINSITDYNRKSAECPSDPSLPDAYNIFYARFESSNTSIIASFKISPDDSPLSITSAEVRNTLQTKNPQKAAGPDGVPGRMFKDCAQQLSSVMADIFNISLSQVGMCIVNRFRLGVKRFFGITNKNPLRFCYRFFLGCAVTVNKRTPLANLR